MERFEAMEDKTFVQAINAMDELHHKKLKEITDEALHSWIILQQEGTVALAIAHIENEPVKDAVSHVLLYMSLQSLLFNAKQHQLITNKHYKELSAYLDDLREYIQISH